MRQRIIYDRQVVQLAQVDQLIATFDYRPTERMRVIVTAADGIRILLDNQQIAAGKWELQNGGDIVGASPDATEAQLGPLLSVTLSSVGAVNDTFRLRYTWAHFEMEQLWNFAGEDISITSRITNKSDPLPLKMLRFGPLNFTFAHNITPSTASGFLRSAHYTYLQANKSDLLHPSQFAPLGCAYAQDGAYGIGLHSRTHLLGQKLFHAVWASDNIIPAGCALEQYVLDEIGLGQTKVIDAHIRISRNTDWKYLLAPYKTDFDAALGPMAYTPDDRALASFSAADVFWARPDNPYGYADDNGNADGLWRRFDHDNSATDGVRGFAAVVGDPLVAAGGQGCILWNPQGFDPRNAAYRPDFDVFPPEPASHVAVLTAQFASRNLRIGLLARPGHYAERLNYTSDTATRLSAASDAQMAVLLGRFANMTAAGFNVWYFDSFGFDLNDFKIMQRIRAQLGPSIPTYAEFGSDIILKLTGRYIWHVGGDYTNVSKAVAAVHRWLVPTTSWVCLSQDGTTIDQLGQEKLTPIIQDYQVAGSVAQIVAMQAAYQTGHNWKP